MTDEQIEEWSKNAYAMIIKKLSASKENLAAGETGELKT